MMMEMVEMGFHDIDANKEALQETQGDIFEAIEYLEKRSRQSERIISNGSSSSTFSNKAAVTQNVNALEYAIRPCFVHDV